MVYFPGAFLNAYLKEYRPRKALLSSFCVAFQACRDKGFKQRVRFGRAGFEFRVVLNAD